MTIDKTKLNAVLAAADDTTDYVSILANSVTAADANNEFASTFTNIFENIQSVEAWASQKLLEAEQEEVMNGFLSELKVVFDKYSANMEIGSHESGYGTNYGGGGSIGVKFVATLDGVTASKEINKALIVSGDLV